MLGCAKSCLISFNWQKSVSMWYLPLEYMLWRAGQQLTAISPHEENPNSMHFQQKPNKQSGECFANICNFLHSYICSKFCMQLKFLFFSWDINRKDWVTFNAMAVKKKKKKIVKKKKEQAAGKMVRRVQSLSYDLSVTWCNYQNATKSSSWPPDMT